jgi:anti-sigma factor RsiW
VNCDETRRLLHGYVDGELDLPAALALEEHLRDCAACAQAHAALRDLRAAVQGADLYHPAPPALRDRVRAAIRRDGEAGRAPRKFPWRGLAVAASLAFVLLAGWDTVRALAPRPADDRVAEALVAGHVRAQMLDSHRVDVESSDQHTVKPWFEGKVDFAPPVFDLRKVNVELIGGRLDYVNNRPVAVLVYRERKHHIDLYVWPSAGGAAGPSSSSRQGYHMIRWAQGGLTFWAVSDINEADLQLFVQSVRLLHEQAP